MSIAKQILPAACLLLAGCGGGGSNPPALVASAPSAPLNVTANRGDTAMSLGWDAPFSNGGAAIDSYSLVVTPTVPANNVLVSGSHALINNLTNGTSYTVTVRAHNSAGNGASSTAIAVTPNASSTSLYTPITIQGDTSPSGIFDPSVLRLTNGDLWMSYSSVHYYNNPSMQLVQDVGINLAKSTDGGNSFTFEQPIATPSVATVTDTSLTACGTSTCTGRWVYETSWLIDDATDPNPARRYKLFAHKYFLHPGSTNATFYELGAIVMWTASSPDATWSAETSLLGWNLTPPQLTPLRIVNSLSPSLASCIVVAEGGATVTSTGIDFVFTCVTPGANPLPQSIVLLRTTDHANTFSYVSTLLTPSDIAPLPGASFYTAPSLSSTNGPAPVLIATPAFGGVYQGCMVFPIADPVAGTLFRANGLPIAIAYAKPISGDFGGACAFDRGLGSNGLLLNDVPNVAQQVNAQFRILATHLAL